MKILNIIFDFRFACFCIIAMLFPSASFSQENQVPVHCIDSGRYSGNEKTGITGITSQIAGKMVSDYREKHTDDPSVYKTTGFMISKKALDQIFDTPGINAIGIDLVEDEGVLRIVFKGVITEYTGIGGDQKSIIFLAEENCPIICTSW